MTKPQLMPWIGGPVKFEADLSPLVCPIDETVASQIIESDAKVVDAAVQKARRTIVDNSSDAAQRLGFGLPVLYLRESDSLFATEGPMHGQDKILPSEFSPCPWCSARNTAVDKFCGECRGQLICPACGLRVDRRRASCGNCDYILSGSSVPSQSVLAPSKRSEFVNPEHEGQLVAQIIGREGSPKNRPS